MEYPFKDLMPLDEVLEREGYYKDWTHLDPKTFYSIVQISEMIKTKGFGTDVRLLISQLAEHFGLSVVKVTDIANKLMARQDAVEDFNNQVIQEMTDKDVISAPEIIQARGGKPTLGARLDETKDLINQTGINLRKDIEQHGFDIRWNEHLVVDGDWTQALQQALDDSPDDGRTIFIGQDIRIDSTIIWPNKTGDNSITKPCTIQGMAKNRGSGVINDYQKGEVAILFTGDGALFDLRNGTNSLTNSSVSFRDISLYGEDKEGSIGINADSVMGANFENMQFRRFDVGLRVREVYYATFDNLRFFYNLSYGLNVEGEVNHAKFHRCNFGNTTNGIGARVYYGQTGVVFDGCWFEGNETALSLEYCMQVLLQGCYFEENTNTMNILGHVETGQTTVTIIGSNITNFEGSRNSPIYTSGNTKYLITLIGNTIFHWRTDTVLIGGDGDKQVVDINNHTGNIKFEQPANIALSVNEDGVFTNQLHAGAQVYGDVTGTTKTGKMEVFNRNGNSAGWIQLYEG